MTVLPDNILKLMRKEDRPKGNSGKTRKECEHAYSYKLEKDEHKTFSQWLNLKEIPFIHAQNHKKSTIEIGWPDYTIIYNGCSMCIEFKVKGNKPSEDQLRVFEKLESTGTSVHVCENASEAILHVREWWRVNEI